MRENLSEVRYYAEWRRHEFPLNPGGQRSSPFATGCPPKRRASFVSTALEIASLGAEYAAHLNVATTLISAGVVEALWNLAAVRVRDSRHGRA